MIFSVKIYLWSLLFFLITYDAFACPAFNLEVPRELKHALHALIAQQKKWIKKIVDAPDGKKSKVFYKQLNAFKIPQQCFPLLIECVKILAEKCSICLKDFEQGESISLQSLEEYCFHIFHAECLQEWLNVQKTCPLCKREYLPEYQKKMIVIDEDLSHIDLLYEKIKRSPELLQLIDQKDIQELQECCTQILAVLKGKMLINYIDRTVASLLTNFMRLINVVFLFVFEAITDLFFQGIVTCSKNIFLFGVKAVLVLTIGCILGIVYLVYDATSSFLSMSRIFWRTLFRLLYLSAVCSLQCVQGCYEYGSVCPLFMRQERCVVMKFCKLVSAIEVDDDENDENNKDEYD